MHCRTGLCQYRARHGTAHSAPRSVARHIISHRALSYRDTSRQPAPTWIATWMTSSAAAKTNISAWELGAQPISILAGSGTPEWVRSHMVCFIYDVYVCFMHCCFADLLLLAVFGLLVLVSQMPHVTIGRRFSPSPPWDVIFNICICIQGTHELKAHQLRVPSAHKLRVLSAHKVSPLLIKPSWTGLNYDETRLKQVGLDWAWLNSGLNGLGKL